MEGFSSLRTFVSSSVLGPQLQNAKTSPQMLWESKEKKQHFCPIPNPLLRKRASRLRNQASVSFHSAPGSLLLKHIPVWLPEATKAKHKPLSTGTVKEYIVLKRGHCPWLLRETGLLSLAVNRELEFRQVFWGHSLTRPLYRKQS